MKFLLVLVVVVVVLAWVMRRPRVTTRSGAEKTATADMVACAHCGVHVPAHDALADGRRHYCSEAHRLAGPRDRDA
ncbi:MAG: PP0621 family protein [Burkholderiaceae bacterium]